MGRSCTSDVKGLAQGQCAWQQRKPERLFSSLALPALHSQEKGILKRLQLWLHCCKAPRLGLERSRCGRVPGCRVKHLAPALQSLSNWMWPCFRGKELSVGLGEGLGVMEQLGQRVWLLLPSF